MPPKLTRYVEAEPVSVLSLPCVRKWFSTNNYEKVSTLLEDNRISFTRMFGKRHQTFTSEYRYDVWRVPYQGAAFWILSAKGKGTCIEVEMPFNDDILLISFLDMLLRELKLRSNDTEDF